MTVFSSPAKINLFLRVVGRRADGRHEIETVFQRLDWGDRLRIEAADVPGLELVCRGETVDCGPEENLVTRAFHALCGRSGETEKPRGARVVLDKEIPVGGGLGGGSSNAAATLLGLNQVFGLGVAPDTLAQIALSLGADVPFFLGPPCAIGRGVGEKLTPVPSGKDYWALLALPEFGVSTAEVYADYDATQALARDNPASDGRNSSAPELEDLLQALLCDNLDNALALMHNSLEAAAFHVAPKLALLHAQLESLAEQPVRVTGSGATLFTLARTKDESERLAGVWEGVTEVRIARFEVTSRS